MFVVSMPTTTRVSQYYSVYVVIYQIERDGTLVANLSRNRIALRDEAAISKPVDVTMRSARCLVK